MCYFLNKNNGVQINKLFPTEQMGKLSLFQPKLVNQGAEPIWVDSRQF